ncbi:MAG TPA: cytochrome c3 family protein [Coriobacteriia bacterium]|nr:cytochrome c3 family protein [Coriobacteriia bacterium]
MSLFDNMPGRKRSKVKLPRAAKLAASSEPIEEVAGEQVDEAGESAPVVASETPAEDAPVEETPVEETAREEATAEDADEIAAVAPEFEPEPEVIAPVVAPEPEPEPEAIAPAVESEPEITAATGSDEAPGQETVEPEAEVAPPVHEKVEGIEDIADVVVPGAVVAGAAAAGGLFKPKKPRSVGLPKSKQSKPEKTKEPKPAKIREPKAARRSGSVTKSAEVVGLGGSRRAVKVREPKVREPKQERPKRERRKVKIIEGFRDPVRRPRSILWAGVAVLLIAGIMVPVLGVTSTRWFCAEACHKVQDDTIIAYEHSSHREISCMACHMPVGASPVIFILHKAEALGELYLTVTGNYELPLNGESEVALTMKSTQCTQCHDTENRKITPTVGLKIDHKAHEEKGVECTVCHNRIAHNEDFKLVLKDPKTGEPNKKHESFMSMTACFRCHTQNATANGSVKAPGQCIACHPAGYETKKPPSHLEAGFFPKGHGDLGKEAAAKVASTTAEAKTEGADGEESGGKQELGPSLPKVESINECSTCHSDKFCSDCHGNVIMPHPADFKKNHGATGKKNPDACAKCHGAADRFCDECHHKTSIKRKYDPSRTWFQQHPDAVKAVGATACFKCHEPTYCARCHTRGTVSQ